MRRSAAAMLLVITTACTVPPEGAIDETRTVAVGSTERVYRLVVPADRMDPVPLVIVFHGFGSSWHKVRDLTAFDDLADSRGFAVAFPSGAGLIASWRTEAALSAPDVAFVRQIVEDVGGVVDLDRSRVYAAGMSNGGGMAGRLACDASDVIAAVGMVAAAHGPGACDQDRPVPLIAFHGDADRIVPLDGIPFIAQDVDAWLGSRALDNGCDPVPDDRRIAVNVVEYAWAGCDADVVHHLVEGGRHGWPGSSRAGRIGDSTTALSATDLMWEFFSAHPMP